MSLILIFGIAIVLLGAAFHWVNRNTPYETFLPEMLLPIGTGVIVFGLGGLLL